MIKVLIVEDSAVVAEYLSALLGAEPNLQVVGVASDGHEALEAVRRTRPDVITMDIHMPRVDGFEATRGIMENCPTPIVIVSGSTDADEVATHFRALEAGALAVVARPKGPGAGGNGARELVDAVKLMSEVKVVKRWVRGPASPRRGAGSGVKLVAPPAPVRVVVIGASTGGPLALQAILSGLRRDLPVPVLAVQHMTPGFTQGFVEWLSTSTGFPVRQARDGESPQAGHVYIAPDNWQMGIAGDHRIVLRDDPRENGMRPSVSYLFRSALKVHGAGAVGVLLTGMGEDGVRELRQLREAGAVTIAQDKESSVVYGMPGQAVLTGAAVHVLPPGRIARALGSIFAPS
ncbi:MAG: chemotaxis-specific protein-glutamate methyltransferase CheB [Verrucomicrobiota bacterium]